MNISGEDFNVRVEGPEDAPAVMLSNSLGSNLGLWDAQAAALARRFRVIRYDFARGHGASVPDPGPFSIERLGRDALAILDALGVRTAHWIGLSMGAMVGQWLLANAGERFERAILANTASHYPDSAPWNARIAMVRRRGMAPIVDGVIERWFSPQFRRSNAAEVEAFAAALRATPAQSYASSCAAIRDMDLRETRRRIANPTLVIVGTQDAATPPALGQAIAAAIAGARVHELDAAHLSNVERPDEFSRVALEFLGEGAR